MPAATNVQAKKKAGSTVREHLPGLAITRAIMQLIQASSNLTMSSREIAGLTGKELSHVHRDIRAMLDELKDDPSLDHVREDKDARGYTLAFHLDRELTYTLLTGYSIPLRRNVVARWQELESQQAPKPAELSRMDILQLAIDAEHGRIKAEAALAIAAPKAQALDRIAGADGSLCLRDAAKQLQVKPKHFNLWLQANKWIYKRAGCSNYIGYQDRIQSGLIEHKASIVIDGAGNERMRDQARITAKGIARLAEVFAQEVAA